MSPLGIGDKPYPQDLKVKQKYITLGLAISKGLIYTSDVNGRLIVPISTTGVADLSLGIFQAADVAPAPVANDTDTVQTFTNKSRIILKAPAGLVEGQDVELSSSGSVTTQDTCMAAVFPRTKGFLGRIFEIYTKNTNGSIKEITALNDLVVIEVGAA
jgi:hypothetical protein